MRHAVPAAEVPLIADLNTTPLIDVMLVLLVMFIITIPITTHEVPLDLPQGGGVPQVSTTHRLELAASGGLTLDGQAIAPATLPGRLAAIGRAPDAVLVMKTDPEARYELFLNATAAVKRAGITRLGFERGGVD